MTRAKTPAKSAATYLVWYPRDAQEWLARCVGLDIDEYGALSKVADIAWLRTPPGTIANTEAEFISLLGKRWRKLLPVILRHFTPDPDHPGLLRCEWMVAQHAEQSARYENFTKAGRERARQRAMQFKLNKEKGQLRLKIPKAESSDAGSDATEPLIEKGKESTASLVQMLEGSSALRAEKNPAAVAFAGGAPAPAAEDPGSGFDQLRTWADSDPAIAAAVENRMADLVKDIPPGVQVPGLRHAFELRALQAEFTEFTARQTPEAL